MKILVGFLSGVLATAVAEGKDLPVLVKAAKVAQAALTEEKIYPVYVQLKQSAQLSAQVAATVNKVYFQAGQTVKKGQKLFELNNPDWALALAQAQAQQAQAQQDLSRLQGLENNQWVSADKISQAKTALKLATLAKQQASADWAKLTVTAPFTGQIQTLKVTQGENIAKEQVLLTLANLDSRFLSCQLPLTALTGTQTPQAVRVVFNQQSFTSPITALINEGQALNPYARVELRLPTAYRHLPVGQLGQLHWPQQQPPSLTVPLAALRYQTHTVYVWRVNAEKIAQLMRVKPLFYGRDHVAIASELRAGDWVIVDGFTELKQGVTVVIAP